MLPVATRAATAALTGAAFTLTLVFCSTAGADPVTTTTSAAPTTTTAPSPTPTSRPASPTPKTRPIVLIGTAESVQSSGAQSLNVATVRQAASNGAARTLPHTGTASVWLTLLGFTLVLVGALAIRGQNPQLRLAERS